MHSVKYFPFSFHLSTSVNMAETTISGNCLCGAIQYELLGPPIVNVLCHCNNCRKSTGSSFMANSFYKKAVPPLPLLGV